MDENQVVQARLKPQEIDLSNKSLLIGDCDGMYVRMLSSQCLDEILDNDAFGSDVSAVFNFAKNITKTDRRLRQKLPALSYVDYYGHTAFDGLSYVQLVEVELPKLKELAIKHRETELAMLIGELLGFIKKNRQEGDHWLLIFDGV